MITTELTDTLKITNQFISNSDNDVFNYHNIWMWIAIIELVLILYLLLFQKKPESTRAKFKREAKGEVIDFENIINSSFHVKPLYDELKVKCHPDRFIKDSEKNQVAIELSQEISKNKTNYKKLIELKELAKQKLNINF